MHSHSTVISVVPDLKMGQLFVLATSTTAELLSGFRESRPFVKEKYSCRVFFLNCTVEYPLFFDHAWTTYIVHQALQTSIRQIISDNFCLARVLCISTYARS